MKLQVAEVALVGMRTVIHQLQTERFDPQLIDEALEELRKVVEAVLEIHRGGLRTVPEAGIARRFVTNAELREREKANMIAALRHANWRVWGTDGAAALLGLKPSTLTYRMKVFGIGKHE